MKKSTKYLLIAGVAIDVAITLFLFVVSVIIIILTGKYGVREAPNHASGLILFLLKNTTVYFWGFVFPLFVLLAGNIIGLVFYVKKTSKEEQPKLQDLSEEQKEALRQELLRDLMKETDKESQPKEENKNE